MGLVELFAIEGEDHVRQYAEDHQLHPEEDRDRRHQGEDLVGDPLGHPFDDDVEADQDSEQGADGAEAAEVKEGVVRLRQPIQGDEDDPSVTDRMQVGARCRRACPIGNGHDGRRDVVFDAFDGELSLDAEAIGREPEPADGRPCEGPIAAEDVLEIPAMNGPERPVDQPVADLVEPGHRTGLHVSKAVPDDVVGPPGQDGPEHGRGVGR